jgi:hypothetical protein
MVYSDSSQDYFTPCSPECTVAIDRYLEERATAGEVLKYESPLIRNLYDSLSVKAKVVRPLSMEGIKYLVGSIVKLSGIRKEFEFKGQVKMSRGVRKMYKGEADMSGMIPAAVELTQGYSIGVPGHYLRLKDSEILKEYEKVIDRITIDDKHRLRKRNQELEFDQAAEIAMLKKELQSYDDTFTKYAEYYETTQEQMKDMSEMMDRQGRLIENMGREILGFE